MTQLPDNETIAELFNSITSTMLQLECMMQMAENRPERGDLLHCSALLCLPGQTPVTIAISSDKVGCQKLASALFATAPEDISEFMISDTIKELANMLAGQIKGALDIAQNLQIPKLYLEKELETTLENSAWLHLVCKVGEANVLVSLSEDASVAGHYAG